jgi:hypothetical protein
MEITVYYVLERVGEEHRYYSGPHPHYPAASLARREAAYADLKGDEKYVIGESVITIKELL